MEKGFWQQLSRPIIGLAPMDGLTDEPFRLMTVKYGGPDLLTTEFVSVEGICAGAVKILDAFIYSEQEQPIMAQLFGATPEAFYKAFFVAAQLGFDGIEINMGCPAKNISSMGAGASLIKRPALAKKIIRNVQKAAKDFTNGITFKDIGLPDSICNYLKNKKSAPRNIPISIKTRIGYGKNNVKDWIKHLLETEPANITIHGRTLKQMYSGSADWEAIGCASELARKTDTSILGNGDIKSIYEARAKCKEFNLDGVLIGRSALGNPWIFAGKNPQIKIRLKTAAEHSRLYEKIFKDRHFLPMRKHLGWYCKGFPNASNFRQKIMQANNAKEVEEIIAKEFNL
jgi:tRNA-dihydrouridine synthase B